MANSATPVHPRCPFCGEEILPSQKKSKDHVFLDALGGRVTVLSHETCNNQSGSSAEGELQRPNSVINLMKAAKGLGSSPIRGTFPSVRRADLDLTDGSVYSPPSFIKSADGTDRRRGAQGEARRTGPRGVQEAMMGWRAQGFLRGYEAW
jgi:hypothetical protein